MRAVILEKIMNKEEVSVAIIQGPRISRLPYAAGMTKALFLFAGVGHALALERSIALTREDPGRFNGYDFPELFVDAFWVEVALSSVPKRLEAEPRKVILSSGTATISRFPRVIVEVVFDGIYHTGASGIQGYATFPWRRS